MSCTITDLPEANSRWAVLILLASVLLSGCTSGPTSLDYSVSMVPDRIASFPWQTLLTDPEGDGAGYNDADGAALAYHFDAQDDRLWFRFDLHAGFSEDRPAMSLSFDIDGDTSNGIAWYGANESFMVDLMVSVGLLARQGDRWGGYNGLTDAQGIGNRDWINVKDGAATFYLDTEAKRYYVGIERSDLGATAEKIRLIGSVGANARWNDDIGDNEAAVIRFDSASPSQP